MPRYPFSVSELIQLAQEEYFPEGVINFYKSFPADEVFEDADDLMARTEQIEIMEHQESKQPENFLDTFDED